MNPFCEAVPCPIILSSTCVFYEGGNLICTGINTNDTLEMALIKIDQAICAASGTSGTSGTSGLTGTSGTSGTNGSSGDKYRTPSYSLFDVCDPALAIVNPGLAYSVGQTIIIAHDQNNSFEATVTSYNPSTGELAFINPVNCIGSGTYSSWTINLAGASGGDGSSGTSGSNGSSGTNGTSGTNGRGGSSGTSGVSGTSGSNGSSGSSGSSGTHGTSGTSGADGGNGSSGTSGSHGSSGTSGLNGTFGTSGSNGRNGTSGTSGTSATDGTGGTSGTSGSNGSSGSAGTSGTTGTSGTGGTSGSSGATFSYRGTSNTCVTLPLAYCTTTTTSSSSSTTTTTTTVSVDCAFEGTAEEVVIPVTGLIWDTTVNNPCNATPWEITNANLTIRYNITNSVNCGGTCNSTQSGTATATITVGGTDVNMGLDFKGIGELQDPDFEKILFKLDGVQVANAHAAGGSLGCQMGPVIKTYITPSPYFMAANSVHTLLVEFTTNDGAYHVGAFYEVNLSFTEL
jgi:hypothetical protein